MIFGGRRGGVFGSSGSGVIGGGRKTISRVLFDRPLPLSFSSSDRQQSVQMSNSRPSICFWKHSFWLPHRSQRITLGPPFRFEYTPAVDILAAACRRDNGYGGSHSI